MSHEYPVKRSGVKIEYSSRTVTSVKYDPVEHNTTRYLSSR